MIAVVAAILVVKTTVAIVANYVDYLPPNFQADFLIGREDHFFGRYQWAFNIHITSSPIALMLGLFLVSDRFRLAFPRWHRRLGRIMVPCTAFLVAPSGLWMAFYAAAGSAAALGFIVLSLLTAVCALLGWRTAVQRRFDDHRRWMWRTFLLLCSAVVLRVLGGAGTVFAVPWPWYDAVAGWISWVVPLVGFEIFRRRTA